MLNLILPYVKKNGLESFSSLFFRKIFGEFKLYKFILYRYKYPSCRIYSDSILGDVVCGKNVSIWGARMGNSTIGDYTYIGGLGTSIANADIGKYCSINAGVKVTPKGHTNHMKIPSTYTFHNVFLSPFFDPEWMKNEKMERTIIGNDVFIGTNAIILGGVRIGNGSVIGAGSVITKDVPAYTIYAGNPGRLIRQRFNPDTIIYLEKLQWWDKTESEIKDLLPFLTSPINDDILLK